MFSLRLTTICDSFFLLLLLCVFHHPIRTSYERTDDVEALQGLQRQTIVPQKEPKYNGMEAAAKIYIFNKSLLCNVCHRKKRREKCFSSQFSCLVLESRTQRLKDQGGAFEWDISSNRHWEQRQEKETTSQKKRREKSSNYLVCPRVREHNDVVHIGKEAKEDFKN